MEIKECHLSQVLPVTCMNPVFLSVVPAASTRGEQGTQATAATVACQKILLIHLLVPDGNGAQGTPCGAPDGIGAPDSPGGELHGNGAPDTPGGRPDTPGAPYNPGGYGAYGAPDSTCAPDCFLLGHFFAHPKNLMHQVYLIHLLPGTSDAPNAPG